MDRHVIIDNFWRVGVKGDRSLAKEDLGWSDIVKNDAQSDYPEDIFRYVVEVEGLNILFYWVEDRNFYTIETEKRPIEVRKLFPNPKWDGKYEFQKAGLSGSPTSSSPGEVLATFDDPTQIWNELRINDVPIGTVIDDSLIVDLD